MLELGDDPTAKVLVVDSDPGKRFAGLERMQTAGRIELWTARDRAGAVETARVQQPEVAIVELAFRDCDGPAVALQIVAAARYVETVFFAGPQDEGEIAAARDLGLGRVIQFSEVSSQLERVLGPLAECARLRRLLAAAEKRLQKASLDERLGPGPHRVALPEAERRYRELYVRSLLAETGNRREAARRAGVPYTTFCEIIRKLGIPDPEMPRESRSG